MTGTDPLELQVCLRPFAPEEIQHRQREILDRVEQVATDAGHEAAVVWWSPKVSMPDADGPFVDSVPPVVADLLATAEQNGFSLAPFVGERSNGPLVQRQESLVLPLASLVVRVDDEIRGLYPVEFDGQRYTVEDGLEALENGESVTNLDRVED
ncbi:HTH domain-containing protein [Halobacteriales archaeon Cl-PHB]